jgi:hypothetical protein
MADGRVRNPIDLAMADRLSPMMVRRSMASRRWYGVSFGFRPTERH